MRNKTLMILTGVLLVITTIVPAIATQGAKRNIHKSKAAHEVQSVTVKITKQGYEPKSFTLKPNVLARVTFVREVEKTCGTEIVIPDYNISRPLPLNKHVVVEFTPDKSGEFNFSCGMGMLHGKIVVQ